VPTEDVVTYVDGVHVPLRLEIVERELVPDCGNVLVAVAPGEFVVVRGLLEHLLFLGDVAHVLIRLAARLVVEEATP